MQGPFRRYGQSIALQPLETKWPSLQLSPKGIGLLMGWGMENFLDAFNRNWAQVRGGTPPQGLNH
jgi:hypothetical protein